MTFVFLAFCGMLLRSGMFFVGDSGYTLMSEECGIGATLLGVLI